MHITEAIAQAAKDRNVSGNELAKRSGIFQPVLHRMLSKHLDIRWSTLVRLTKALGLRVSTIVRYTEIGKK